MRDSDETQGEKSSKDIQILTSKQPRFSESLKDTQKQGVFWCLVNTNESLEGITTAI